MKLDIFPCSETEFFVQGMRLNNFSIRILPTIKK